MGTAEGCPQGSGLFKKNEATTKRTGKWISGVGRKSEAYFMKEKKQSDVAVLLEYAGSYKGLTFLGLGLSALAMILGMAPYICIWLVARDLIAAAPNWTSASGVARYGWMAFGFAVPGSRSISRL